MLFACLSQTQVAYHNSYRKSGVNKFSYETHHRVGVSWYTQSMLKRRNTDTRHPRPLHSVIVIQGIIGSKIDVCEMRQAIEVT